MFISHISKKCTLHTNCWHLQKNKTKLLIKKERENTLLAFTILPTKSKSKETILWACEMELFEDQFNRHPPNIAPNLLTA